MLRHAMLWKSQKSCVTPEAVEHARTIFGKNHGGLRGKTVCVKPERVEVDVVAIPRNFYEINKFVTLVGDVMFVEGMPFMLTRSRDIRFGNIELFPAARLRSWGAR